MRWREKRRGEGPLGQGRGREEERGWRRAGEEDAVRGQRRRRLRHRRRVGQGPRRRLPLVQPSLSRISPAPVTRDTRVLFPASRPAQRRLWLLLPPSGLPPPSSAHIVHGRLDSFRWKMGVSPDSSYAMDVRCSPPAPMWTNLTSTQSRCYPLHGSHPDDPRPGLHYSSLHAP